MSTKHKISIFWFRRDLRLEDNTALYHALKGPYPVLPLFIFDSLILDKLEDQDDARVSFIFDVVCRIYQQLKERKGNLLIKHGRPLEIFKSLSHQFDIGEVYANGDYEPYALERDKRVSNFLQEQGILFHTFKDQVIFEKEEILSDTGAPYKVFTPYSKKWLKKLSPHSLSPYPSQDHLTNLYNFFPAPSPPSLESLGFKRSNIQIPSQRISLEKITQYDQKRDFPFEDGTSRLGIHLRFGTISIRHLVQKALELNEKYLQELIWREFYMMILFHHPYVVEKAFKPQYDKIPWQNKEADFNSWCEGKTGIPLVDAGMRQLKQTGFMHNRVRMVTASFLTKNLLIDWRWGEAWFARYLLDYELASNNGGWQWAAGSGVDSQPYFRIFNPETQAKSYDAQQQYIRQWIPEFGTNRYPEPMVDLKESRAFAISYYKKHLNE